MADDPSDQRRSRAPAAAPVGSQPPASGARGGDPRIGAVLLGRIRIVRPIARGGMGRVYLGEQVPIGRPCAVKILDVRDGTEADRTEFARRFLLEASVASKLAHPNVVTIFDYGETPDGACFIAMEYLEGSSLSEEIRARGTIPAARAIRIAVQVSRALRAAHTLGVVHRDLKPGNVFLATREHEEDVVKVLDFGLVKQTAGDAEKLTQVGRILGSPRYMAPEQVQGGRVDPRTDVYSLGAVLYAMLAGRAPFEKSSDVATMLAQVTDPPPPIASVAPDAVLPPGLEAVVMKCLAKNPDDRFASMEELAVALKPVTSVLPPASDSVRPPGTSTRPPPASRPVTSDAPSPTARPPSQTAPGPYSLRSAWRMLGGEAVSKRTWWFAGAAAAAILVAAAVVAGRAPGEPVVAPGAPQVAIVPQSSGSPSPPSPTSTLHVETDPPGAKVKEEGDTMCETTPCDIVYRGELADPGYEHLLMFLKSGYKLERKIVKTSASPFSVKLTKAR